MSSMQRTIEGDVLVHHLTQDERMIDRSLLAQHGRSARTLVKEGPLRLTLIGLAAGGDLPAHRTGNPITIHQLDGEVVFQAIGKEYVLHTGDVLSIAAGVEHSARSEGGGTFLLTIFHPPSPGTRVDEM